MRMRFRYWFAALLILWTLLFLGLAPGEARLIAPPLLQVSQQITPEEIFVSDSGLQPSVASITLNLVNPTAITPLDIILVLDASSGADLNEVRAMGQGVIAQLGAADRVGLVVYAGGVRTLLNLTDNFQRASEVISDILPDSGSDLLSALRLANDELLRYGRVEAARAILLTSTGLARDWNATMAQAERSARLGIRIFGFGASEVANEHLLSRLADMTGGAFYSHYSTNGLAALFAQLPRQILPPSDIVVTEVLPPYVDYLGAEINPPTRVDRLTPITPTILTWLIPALPEASQWQTTFNVSVSRTGRLSVFSELPLIRYLSYEGPFTQRRQVVLPTLRLTVQNTPTIDFEFGPANPLVGETIVFIGTSLPGKLVQQWQWDFGDQTTGTGQIVVHRYQAPGAYKVRLTATDRSGAAVIIEKVLPVKPPALIE